MTETANFIPQNRDEIVAWLTGMDEVDRGRVAKLLLDQKTQRVVGAVLHQAAWAISRERGAKAAADALGATESSVRNSITFHNKAMNSQVQG